MGAYICPVPRIERTETFAARSKMKLNFIVLYTCLGLISSEDKDNENVMAILAKERQEMKELFRRENIELRQEVAKLRRENEKLHKADAKLHQADHEIKQILRQKDQNNTAELEMMEKSSFRQEDVHSELRKMMKKEITEYLKEEKICVTGRFPCKGGSGEESKFVNVKFGHTFLRKPAVSYAISAFQGNTGSKGDYFCLFSREVKNITPSTADMKIEKCAGAITHCYYSWIACL